MRGQDISQILFVARDGRRGEQECSCVEGRSVCRRDDRSEIGVIVNHDGGSHSGRPGEDVLGQCWVRVRELEVKLYSICMVLDLVKARRAGDEEFMMQIFELFLNNY